MPKAEREKLPLDANKYEAWKTSPDARKYVSASVLEEALACGGQKFGVEMPTHQFDVVVELTSENIESANCMLVSAKRHGIPFVISDSEK